MQGSVNSASFDRAMSLLIAAIANSKFLEGDAPQAIRQTLAMHFVSSLATLLKGNYTWFIISKTRQLILHRPCSTSIIYDRYR